MRLAKQIAVLLVVVVAFAVFNGAVFSLCTRRCLPAGGEVPKAKTIELDRYLPFDKDSQIVQKKADIGLSGQLPVLDGAEGLYPVFSAVANALYPEDSVSFDGENFSPGSRLQMNNTLRAYKAVVDGASDLVFNAGPSEEQLAYAEERGVELEFVPIGREAFVFLVNRENPVDSLTVEQVRDIYGGKYRSWAELGGDHVPINATTRLPGSGSQTALEKFLQGEKPVSRWDSFLGAAIGFSFRYYVSDVIANGGVKMLALNGVYPDQQSVASGEYPVVSEFYVLYDKANRNPNIPKIVDWLLSEEGQRLIEETGYCSLGQDDRRAAP